MASSSKKPKFDPPKSGPFWRQGPDSEESSESDDSEIDDAVEELDDSGDDETFRIYEELASQYDQIPYPDEQNFDGRDREGKTISWSNVPKPSSRRRVFNKWSQRPGGLGLRTETPDAQKASTKVELFSLMLDDIIIQKIVKCTNIKAALSIAAWNDSHPENTKEAWVTDSIEIRAYIGLLLMMGVHKCKKMAIRKLWRADPKYKKHPFIATMAQERIRQIAAYIRFDDVTTRTERCKTDKLAAFRDVSEGVAANLHKIYEPTEHLVVDEMLFRFRGRCLFRVYMRSKPGKYGIKCWAIVDAETRFVLNFQIYTGKEGNTPEVNQGKRVLMDMAKNYFGTGRGITADNFFGSREAAEELIGKKITTVFTIRPARIEVPKEITVHRNMELKQSKFLYHGNCMLVAHKPKPGKVVLLMSTQHSLPNISKDEHKKPEVILFYNATKGGVDTVDQMAAEYSCQRKTRRWTLTAFMALLDFTASVNAYILWMQKNPDWEKGNLGKRQLFIEQLAEELILPQIMRKNWNGLSKNIQDSMVIMGAQIPERSSAAPSGRGYCEFDNCRKRTLAKCSSCQKFACPEHSNKYLFCPTCDMNT